MPTSSAFGVRKERLIYELVKLQRFFQEILHCRFMMYTYKASNMSVVILGVVRLCTNVLVEVLASIFRAEIPNFCY